MKKYKKYEGFAEVAAMMAARGCYNNGATVKDLAEQANVSAYTVRRWLKATCPFDNEKNYQEYLQKKREREAEKQGKQEE